MIRASRLRKAALEQGLDAAQDRQLFDRPRSANVLHRAVESAADSGRSTGDATKACLPYLSALHR
jgi:hypothetical protein